jgi:hypothetical protein
MIRDWSSAKPLSSEEIEARAARDEERREKKAQKKHAKE